MCWDIRQEFYEIAVLYYTKNGQDDFLLPENC